MGSKATTVKAYLDELPADRRKEIAKVRSVIKKNLPRGYEEAITFGMIAYQVPRKVLAETYNGQPLCYAALAAHKSTNTVYLMGPYGHEALRKELESEFKNDGKKLDMGKSCVHFKSADDLSLPAIGKAVGAIPMAKYVEIYRESRRGRRK
jgi:hypothetical protein